eukprot:5136416-Amphidinium_carterae.1
MLAEQNRPDRVALEGGLDWCLQLAVDPGLLQKQLSSWQLEGNEADCWCECHIDKRKEPEHVKQAERSGYTLFLEPTPPGTNEGGVGGDGQTTSPGFQGAPWRPTQAGLWRFTSGPSVQGGSRWPVGTGM